MREIEVIMDISRLTMTTNPMNLMNTVNLSVLSMNLDTIEVTGAAMIKMMEQSVHPELGQTIDIKL